MDEKKQLDIQVMSKMRDLGIIGHLNAHFLSDFAIAVQDTDMSSLKMYKNVDKSTDYQIAADFVIQYLKNHGLNFTLNSLKAETHKQIIPQTNITKKELHFKSDDYLEEALDFYLSDEGKPAQIKEENHEQFRSALEARMESLRTTQHPSKH